METVEQFEITKLRVLKNLGPLYFMENCLIFILDILTIMTSLILVKLHLNCTKISSRVPLVL